ncbi:hypothetical protein GY45DRAFT_1439660 [Cubamyces sp. BRFM 1775]|nr:hypothetical protein GY45DRAFT_1439661 [Cubamyces sp. BRFM 1775]KAI0323188.1 hypothetical protein GY45DRAFT_1439660 [Cubamyces sp. BRFM 1775]
MARRARAQLPTHRAVWVLDSAALRKYLVVGHKLTHGHVSEDLSILEHELKSGGLSAEEEQRKREEGARIWQETTGWERSLSHKAQEFFRGARKDAPQEIRERLVIPSLITWIQKHDLFGTDDVRMDIIIPTSARIAVDTAPPVDDIVWMDVEHIQIFIEAANALIEDPQVREEAGLTLDDFTPQVIPQREVIMPTFDREEFHELLLHPGLSHLYGTTGLDLVGPYIARDRTSLVTVGLLKREDIPDYEDAECEAAELF